MIRAYGDWPAEPPLVFTEVTDPAVLEEARQLSEQSKNNNDWLQAHWGDLLPGALGKHLVVAGQEAFLSDSLEEALAQARAAHPEDRGLFARYVNPHIGQRIYAISGEEHQLSMQAIRDKKFQGEPGG